MYKEEKDEIKESVEELIRKQDERLLHSFRVKSYLRELEAERKATRRANILLYVLVGIILIVGVLFN